MGALVGLALVLWTANCAEPVVRKSSPCDSWFSPAALHRPNPLLLGEMPVVHRIHTRYDDDELKFPL